MYLYYILILVFNKSKPVSNAYLKNYEGVSELIENTYDNILEIEDGNVTMDCLHDTA